MAPFPAGPQGWWLRRGPRIWALKPRQRLTLCLVTVRKKCQGKGVIYELKRRLSEFGTILFLSVTFLFWYFTPFSGIFLSLSVFVCVLSVTKQA